MELRLFLSCGTDGRAAPVQKRARTDTVAIAPPSFDIWDDTMTKRLFNEHNIPVRDALESIVALLDTVIASKDLTLILTKPHAEFPEERLPENQVLHIYTKAKYLRNAYCVALERYGVKYAGSDALNWTECCQEAVHLMATGEPKLSPITVTRWHRQFRRFPLSV